MEKSVNEKRDIEIEFWKNDSNESPESNSIENILNKCQQGIVFLDAIDYLHSDIPYFLNANDIFELGGGQGWSSCILKRKFPHLHVTSSDISEYAIKSQFKWEEVFGVKIDKSSVCTSDNLPAGDSTLDIVYAFAAAHHFIMHKETLTECKRALRPGGSLIYIYEPVTPRFFYSLAKWRVNRMRPEVPEDLLVPAELSKFAAELGYDYKIMYFPNLNSRGMVETLYYYLLSKLKFLNRVLPSTAIIVFTKPK